MKILQIAALVSFLSLSAFGCGSDSTTTETASETSTETEGGEMDHSVEQTTEQNDDGSTHTETTETTTTDTPPTEPAPGE